MSLMDSLLGALGGAAGGAGGQQPAMNPMLQIALQLLAGGGGSGSAAGGGLGGLMASLGGGGPAAGGGLGGLMASLGGGAGGGAGGGGLGDLLAAFERNGMGEQVQSWVGTGANLPLAPEQLQQALGGDVLDGLARQAGVSPSEAGAGLAELLPQLIDRLTPQGQLPQAGGFGDIGSIIEALSGRRG